MADKTSLSQRLFLCAELLEHLADLPVGGMNDLHVLIPFSADVDAALLV